MLGPADITEIADGLWRWTARHPEWSPGARKESPADWPREVGSVAYASDDGLVLIDPLVPEGGQALWSWLDGRAAACDGRVQVLTTIKWHRRSRDEVAARYDASTSRAAATLPAGVESRPLRRTGETVFWLSAPRALVVGDRLIGDGRGGLRLCPPSWLRYLENGVGLADVRRALEPLLELDPQRVLVSHGQPVLRGGREAMARALAER
jgi:hypothetical protein